MTLLTGFTFSADITKDWTTVAKGNPKKLKRLDNYYGNGWSPMKHFEIIDSEGTDLLEHFAKIREGFSPEELTRYNVAGAILMTTSSIVMRRNYLGLTQEELAARCGYTIRTISAIENNKMTPSFHRVVRVLYELGYEFELKERDQN